MEREILLWKEKHCNNLLGLERESPECLLDLFKDVIDDDIEEKDTNDCRVVMGKMKRYCIDEVT